LYFGFPNKVKRKMNKRLVLALITGIILGILCVICAAFRLGWQGNQLFLFSLWYSRVIIGLLIGLAGSMVIFQGKLNWLMRGAGLGLAVSAAFFSQQALRIGLLFSPGLSMV